jgi:hypothetical protein
MGSAEIGIWMESETDLELEIQINSQIIVKVYSR